MLLIDALNLRSSFWKSGSTPLSWIKELSISNTMSRKFSSSEFHSGIDVGGKDTMEMGRSSGMFTIIKSTPPTVPCIPLKAQALSDLCYTLQTTFRIKFIAKLEHFQHEALNKQENLHTISIKANVSTHFLGRPCAPNNMHQWTVGN